MSLDVTLIANRPIEIYSDNITHNLNNMAEEAGIYMCIWRPEEIGLIHAFELVPLLKAGLQLLQEDPERFKKFEPENGWGTYQVLVDFVMKYLTECETNPDAIVKACR